LRWLSGKHIARMSVEDLTAAVRPFLPEQLPFDESLLPEAIAAVRTHIETFADARAQIRTLLPPEEHAPSPGPGELQVLGVGRAANVKGPALYTPLRRALTGAEHGPALVAILRVQGRDRALAQLDRALAAVPG